MEQINTIALADEHVYPDSEVLQRVLGDGYPAYCALLEIFRQQDMTHDWRYYRDGKAWLCKVEKKKRTIVWMSAWNGFMKATIYFPAKYLDQLYSLDISESTKLRIRETKDVGKSKPVMFEIRHESELAEMTKVMQFKILAK